MSELKYLAFVLVYYVVTVWENLVDAYRAARARGLTHNHVKFFAVNTAFLSTFEAWKDYLVWLWPVVLVLTFVVFLKDEF